MNKSMSMSVSALTSGREVYSQNLQVVAMNRKMKNRLKKIEKNEEKERKILKNQKKELAKALEESEKMFENRQKKVEKSLQAEEQKIDDEISKLTRRLEQLQSDKIRLATQRDSELKPLQQQCSELKDKLFLVTKQLESYEERSSKDFRRLSSTESQIGDSLSDFSPSSPPPYVP